jgi:hypothetical protein
LLSGDNLIRDLAGAFDGGKTWWPGRAEATPYILNSSATGAFNRAYLMMLPLRTEHPISNDISNHKPFFEEH